MLTLEGDSRSFEIWKEAIEKRTGVQITPDRERVLLLLLQRRMKELGHDNIEEYLAESMDVAIGAGEWSSLVDALLIKETSFFRHQASMDFVRHRVMSSVRRKQVDGPFWVWSVGCSTGEEVYSLAITLEQAMRASGVEPHYGIVGTDISREAVLQARRGIYRQNKMHAVSDSVRNNYFDQVGKDLWRVKDSLRRRVCFLTSNVLTEKTPPITRKMHLIYCQNMLIYFRRWKRRELINQLSSSLDENGCMILGLGEVSGWIPKDFVRAKPRSVQAYIRSGDRGEVPSMRKKG